MIKLKIVQNELQLTLKELLLNLYPIINNNEYNLKMFELLNIKLKNITIEMIDNKQIKLITFFEIFINILDIEQYEKIIYIQSKIVI